MIFSDQHVIVLDADGGEVGQMGIWSDELDWHARKIGGYVVVINSEPEQIVADWRTSAMLAAAFASADDCDTCWYLITDTAHDELGDETIAAKLRVHLASGHLTTSEDEPTFCVSTADGWQHQLDAADATDRGLDVDRAYCAEHDSTEQTITDLLHPNPWDQR